MAFINAALAYIPWDFYEEPLWWNSNQNIKFFIHEIAC